MSLWNRIPLTAVILGVLCLAATVSFWKMAQTRVDLEVDQRFTHHAWQIRSSLQERVAQLEGALTACRGLYAADPHVTRSEWSAFVDRGADSPRGLTGLAYIAPVRREHVTSFERRVRERGVPGFEVHPEVVHHDAMAVQFVRGAMKPWLGFDLGSATSQRQSLEASMYSGHLTLAPAVVLGDTLGPLLMLPIYGAADLETPEDRRRELDGWIAALIDLDALFGDLAGADPLRLTVFERTENDHLRVIYEETGDESDEAGGPSWLSGWNRPRTTEAFTRPVPVRVGQRQWVLKIEPGAAWWAPHRGLPPVLWLIVGFLGTGGLFLFLWSNTRKQTEAVGAVAANRDRLNRAESFERRLSLAVGRSPSGVLLLDPDFEIEWFNDAYLRLTGHSEDALRGRNGLEMIAGAHTDPEVLETFETRRREEVPYAVEMIHPTASGSSFWAEVELQPVFDPEGSLEGSVLLVTDIAARRRAELAARESQARFDAVFTETGDAVTLVNPEGSVISANPAAQALFDLSETENDASAITGKVHPDDTPDIHRFLEELILDPGGTRTAQVRHGSKNAGWRMLKFTGLNGIEQPGLECLVLFARETAPAASAGNAANAASASIGADPSRPAATDPAAAPAPQSRTETAPSPAPAATTGSRETDPVTASLFQSLPQAVLLASASGSILAHNRAGRALLDRGRPRGAKRSVWHLPFVDGAGNALSRDCHPASLALDQGEPVQNLVLGIKAGPEHRFAFVHAIPLPGRNGEPTRVLITLQDVSSLFPGDAPAMISDLDAAERGDAAETGRRGLTLPTGLRSDDAPELREQLQWFLTSGERLLTDLDAAVETGDTVEVETTAKELLSQCEPIGAAKVSAACERLLDHLAEGRLDLVPGDLKTIEHRFESLRAYFRKKWLRGAA